MSSLIRDLLIQHGEELLAKPRALIPFTPEYKANVLLNDLEHYPHAFVVACLMDRQYKAEKCWLIPYRFQQKLHSFKFARLTSLSLDEVHQLMSQPEALHRIPKKMAGVFHAAIQRIARQYHGDASNIWKNSPSSATIVKRFLEFEGAGPKIATMAANILVRDFKIPVSDKYSIDVSVDVQVRRAFERLGLIRKDASNEEIIYAARELNPTYPGVIDLALWEIGRDWCRPQVPLCGKCYLQAYCPTAQGKEMNT